MYRFLPTGNSARFTKYGEVALTFKATGAPGLLSGYALKENQRKELCQIFVRSPPEYSHFEISPYPRVYHSSFIIHSHHLSKPQEQSGREVDSFGSFFYFYFFFPVETDSISHQQFVNVFGSCCYDLPALKLWLPIHVRKLFVCYVM